MRPTWTRPPLSPPSSSSRPTTRRWPPPSTLLWLLAYFTLNLTLTLYNKLVLNRFPFPYTLTALHALCGTIGSAFVLHWPSFASSLRRILRRLTWRRRQTRLRGSNPPLTSSPFPLEPSFESDRLTTSRTLAGTPPTYPRTPLAWTVTPPLLLFSTLYTLNIVLSNASLRLVTVPFHQCVRASAPVFVVLIQVVLSSSSSSSSSPSYSSSSLIPAASRTLPTPPPPQNTRTNLPTWPPKQKLLSLIPIVAGVALATYGDYYFTWPGFVLTLAGTGLAALKTVVTGALLGGRGSSMGGKGEKGKRGKERREGDGEEGEGYNRARGEEGKEEEYRDDEGEKNTVLFAHTPTPSTSLLDPSSLPRSTSDVIYETPLQTQRSQVYPQHTFQHPQRPSRSSRSSQGYTQDHLHSDVLVHTQLPDTPTNLGTTTKNNEDLLYPPHQLSPKAPFKFPSPLPSRVPSPTPVSQSSSSSSSSSSFSHEDVNGSKRKRPLSLSAFHPGPIDDTAPSIPLPPLSPSTKPPRTNGVIPAVSSAPRASPSPSPQPTRPHSCSNANGYPGAAGGGASTATEATKTTTRRSPPSFYKHGVHSPSMSSEFGYYPYSRGDYEDIEGTCQAERVEEEPYDGERGKGAGGWNRGWKVHRSTPSRVVTSAFDTVKRTLRSALRLSSLRSRLRFPSLPPFPFSSISNIGLGSLSMRTPAYAALLDVPRMQMPTYTPLQLLYLLSPLAFIQCVALAYFTGELDRVAEHLHALSHLPPVASPGLFESGLPLPLGLVPGLPSNFRFPNLVLGPLGARTSLLLNGLLAFLLNVASFAANKRVGPVGMSVAANTKQAMVVGISVVVFELRVGVVNALGVGVALVGGGVYAWPG